MNKKIHSLCISLMIVSLCSAQDNALKARIDSLEQTVREMKQSAVDSKKVATPQAPGSGVTLSGLIYSY